jgi:hypothetical protein
MLTIAGGVLLGLVAFTAFLGWLARPTPQEAVARYIAYHEALADADEAAARLSTPSTSEPGQK